ncbi:hypothetical protein [Thiohalophilus sp.]|uniref:hypothetical protein n=1 Tax=Thiohalophilus sp. TaxID=3028392 RepID=UPI002ACD4985|nr:hypothetical protein [Thiohalophilus sp.]MDZ7804750.1 hypothetical protein [Thiohalophilus sp.]
MNIHGKILLAGLLLLVGGAPVTAQQLSQEELERWFESDDPHPPASSAADVNEGNLVFLRQPPGKPVHHHHNKLVISELSLATGWVWLQQCHDNMDEFSRVQILFKKGRIRDLAITRADNITESWVEDNSVQLRDVRAGARLCVSGWTQALESRAGGRYTMHNGPFMRKFLDGYYPMRVSMDIDYSGTGLQLVSVSPQQQTGFDVDQRGDGISFNAWFEGRLNTELMFRLAAVN